jgi:hypothetical protein
MSPSKRERYTARICWNSNKWKFPSGESPHLEKGSYVNDAGFGHEEWLFNFAWLLDGDRFHYAFLQPVNHSFSKVTGKTIDLLLYTISPDRTRCYAGEISNCEVLQPAQADKARRIYKERGWLRSMAEQVSDVKGRVEDILKESDATHLFNVRFRPDDADLYDPLVMADRKDAVWKRQRYTLVPAGEEIEKQWRSRRGSMTPPLIRTISRKGVPGVIYDPFHKILQADLLPLLKVRYGDGNVILERNNVDITITDGKNTILIEIKTDSNPRAAIRDAIGQLLEYAYYRPQTGIAAVDLIVIAPGKPDKLADEYIKRLRAEFNIPISYSSYSVGDPLPGVFDKRRSQTA